MPLPITLLPTPLQLFDSAPPTAPIIEAETDTTNCTTTNATFETQQIPQTHDSSHEPELIRPMDNDAASESGTDAKDISSMSVKELRNLCATKGLPNTGKKNEMIERLQSNMLDEVALIDDV